MKSFLTLTAWIIGVNLLTIFVSQTVSGQQEETIMQLLQHSKE
jgi:hypothetical protein